MLGIELDLEGRGGHVRAVLDGQTHGKVLPRAGIHPRLGEGYAGARGGAWRGGRRRGGWRRRGRRRGAAERWLAGGRSRAKTRGAVAGGAARVERRRRGGRWQDCRHAAAGGAVSRAGGARSRRGRRGLGRLRRIVQVNGGGVADGDARFRLAGVMSGRRTMCGISAIISSSRSRSTLSPVNSLPSIGMLAKPGMPVIGLGVLRC